MSFNPGYSNQGYIYQYNIPLFDDLHNFFPDLLYAPLGRFNTAADILIYIREQVRLRADRFSSAQRSMMNYYSANLTPSILSRDASPVRYTAAAAAPPVPAPPVPPQAPAPPQPTVQTIPIAPLQRTSLFSRQDFDFMDNLLNIFTQPAGTISFIGTTLGGAGNNLNLSPVIVRPSNEQIDEATTLINATQLERDQQCTICFENFVEGQSLRRIDHCQHTFHQTCIDRWFTTNVRCPNCRHDIRGENTDPTATEYEYEYDEEEEEDDDASPMIG
jgi:hypothetical protein